MCRTFCWACLGNVYARLRTGADLALFVSVLQAQRVHGADDGGQRLDGVAVNNRLVLLYVIAGETVLVDDPRNKETHGH